MATNHLDIGAMAPTITPTLWDSRIHLVIYLYALKIELIVAPKSETNVRDGVDGTTAGEGVGSGGGEEELRRGGGGGGRSSRCVRDGVGVGGG